MASRQGAGPGSRQICGSATTSHTSHAIGGSGIVRLGFSGLKVIEGLGVWGGFRVIQAYVGK